MIKWDEADIGEEEQRLVLDVVKSGYVGSNGPYVSKFEAEFASKIGVRHAMCTNNGTSALLCALYALREELRDPVVSVATFTFIASVNTTKEVFRKVKLTDCDRGTWNVETRFIPSGVDLLVPVDVGGLPVDYDALKRLGVPIVADSAESIGGMYKGSPVGSQADIHIFSFHRAKIMTTGEGGMVTTNNDELFDRMKGIGNHGYDPSRKPWEYKHSRRAFNFRMTDMQAAVGLAQLRKLDRYVKERREKARTYRDVIGPLGVYQDEPGWCQHPFFFFGVLVSRRLEKFCEEMQKSGIEVKTWTPAHLQDPYKDSGTTLRNSEYVSSRLALLPIHNKLSIDQVKEISTTARGLLRSL